MAFKHDLFNKWVNITFMLQRDLFLTWQVYYQHRFIVFEASASQTFNYSIYSVAIIAGFFISKFLFFAYLKIIRIEKKL